MWNSLKIILCVFVLLYATPGKTQSQTQINQSIDSFMANVMSEFEIETATSIAVVQGQQTVYQNTFGYADISNKQPAKNDTLFYIASATKPMFALTVLEALEHSQYNLSFTLAQMFPEIQFAKEIEANDITIKDLLTHTSGLNDNFLATSVSTSGIHSPSKKRQMLAKLFPNGDSKRGEFDYTNLGYNIVSIWYEKTFNQKWQDAIKSSVFEPLKMTHTTAYMSEASKDKVGIAKPYSFFAENRREALYLSKQDNTMHAAGGVLSTTTDMANFLKVQLNQGLLDQTQSIAPELIALSQQPIAQLTGKRGDFDRTGYAYGWYTGTYKNVITYHHFGSFDGFRPHVSFMPEKNIGLVILNNEGTLNDKLTDLIADFIYSTLLGEGSVESRLQKRVGQLKNMAFGYREKLVKRELDYLVKAWNLSLAKQEYAGVYSHPLAGQVNVIVKDNKITFNWGNLKSSATAYGEQDVMRIKFLPTRPQLVSFSVVNNAVKQLKLDGINFNKNTE